MTSFGHVSDSSNSSQQALWALLEKHLTCSLFCSQQLCLFLYFQHKVCSKEREAYEIWFAAKKKLFFVANLGHFWHNVDLEMNGVPLGEVGRGSVPSCTLLQQLPLAV